MPGTHLKIVVRAGQPWCTLVQIRVNAQVCNGPYVLFAGFRQQKFLRYKYSVLIQDSILLKRTFISNIHIQRKHECSKF